MKHEIRHHFNEQLKALEQQVLEGFDLVIEQLGRAMEAVAGGDALLAELSWPPTIRSTDAIWRSTEAPSRCWRVRLPVAGDLRLVAALLHIAWCLERMGDQCVNIAKLVPLCSRGTLGDEQMPAVIERMGRLVDRQVAQAKDTFFSRSVELAEELAEQDTEVDQLNRQVFRRAIDVGGDAAQREWAMFTVLMARALERIGDNTVDVGEQTVFLVTGELRELADVRHSRGEGPDPA